MNILKKTICLLAVLILCLSTASAAFADSGEKYADRSWDEIVDDVLEQYGASRDAVRVGYLNLVTGEEHYINGDEWTIAASMYKLPLNMYYAELISTGQLVWEDKYPNLPYEDVRNASIIYSDNEMSGFLFQQLGGYDQFRDLTAEYMGVEPGTGREYYFDNKFTAKEFISCLKLLYNERDRFPGIIETMQQAEQERFFMLNEPRFHIAHKYGYISEYGNSYMNDCGLCFTSQPIAIVMFTYRLQQPEELLSAFCTAMCEYTEYQAAKPEPTPEPTPGPTPEPTPEPTQQPVEDLRTDTEEKEGGIVSVIIPFIFIALFLIAGFIIALRLSSRCGARIFWLILSLILCAVIFMLAVTGYHFGTVYASPDGDPRQTVSEFFDDIISADYAGAYDLLRDYSNLGLGSEPADEASRLACEALRSSYSYELIGECSTNKLDAVQRVRVGYLDLTLLSTALAEETPKQLEAIVQSRSNAEIYDENKQYLPEVTQEAYVLALKEVLKNAQNYYASSDMSISLAYSGGRWQILTNPALLKALNGAAGY